MAQLGFETGLPIGEIDGIILVLVGFNLIAALLPTTGRFEEDEAEGSSAAPAAPAARSISFLDFKRFFGLSWFGFSKENEMFVGRMAQLGFAISLIGEALTGKGILAQFDVETGIPLSQTEPLLLAFIAFTLFTAINEGSGKFVDEE